MSSAPLPITEDQRDCLQEVCNVAMGAAGEALAEFSGLFVNLSIPKIRFVEPANMAEALASLRDDKGGSGTVLVSGVVQCYEVGGIVGYALTVITESSFKDLATQIEQSITNDEEALSLLKRLSETLTGTCLPRLAEQLGSPESVQFESPEIVALHVPLANFFVGEISGWQQVLITEINYHLEDHPFNCDLLLVTPDSAIESLKLALDDLL